MPKITIIGAGSTVFLRNIVGDILFLEDFGNAEFALCDIDSRRLDESMLIAEKLNAKIGKQARFRRFLGTSERREALAGSDFVICMFQVGGYDPATIIDFEVSEAHGIRHTIADTLGAAGTCGPFARYPCSWTSATTWPNSARTPCFSTT